MSECVSFLVDVSGLDQWLKCFTYVEYVLLGKVQTQRKTDYAQLSLVNVAAGDGDLPVDNMQMLPATPEAPISIEQVQEWLGVFYREAQAVAEPGGLRNYGMLFNGLLMSVVKLKEFVGKRKMRTKVVVFTVQDLEDAQEDELSTFAEQCPFELVVVDCTVDGALRGSEKWRAVGGSLMYHVDTLVQSIADPRLKLTRPIRTFQGQMRLGDCNDARYPSMCINVEGVPGTKPVTSIARKVMRRDGAQYRAVKSVIEYQIEAEEAPVKREAQDPAASDVHASMVSVGKDRIRKAYRYGSDYVDLPSALDAERRFSDKPGLDIRGFVPLEKLPRHYLCSESMYLLPDAKNGTKGDYLAFVCLVDTLVKTKKLVVVRFVPKSGTEVQMCVLCPLKTVDKDRNEIRMLVLNRLPMSEDERNSSFPRLTQDVALAREDDAMGVFVDSMDLDRASGASTASNTAWYESKLVQKYSDVALEQSTLPLPQDDLLRASQSDPLCIPAISLHRQQQIILECVHEKFILGNHSRGELQIPPMSRTILDKIDPRYGDVAVSSTIKQQFGIAKNEPLKHTDPREIEQEFDEHDPDLLDLDLLLARGARS